MAKKIQLNFASLLSQSCICSAVDSIHRPIVTIKSVCRCSQLAAQVAILARDRLGRSLKIVVSTDGPSFHEFASQFVLVIFYKRKIIMQKLSRNRDHRANVQLNEPATP